MTANKFSSLKRNFKLLTFLVTFSFSIIGSGFINAQCIYSYTTATSGDYSNPATWIGNIPPPITIPSDVSISLMHNITFTGLVENNGLISSSNGSTITNNGTFSGKGTIEANIINNGSVLPGTTLSLPYILTTSPSNITCASVMSGGTICHDGESPITGRGVCYGTDPLPTTANGTTSDGIGVGTFVSNVINLTGGQTYYLRAYATNASGTAYGNEYTFTTTSCNLPNATSTCSGGVCVIDFCDPGYADCNNNATDGCEVNIDNGPNNCGSCGSVCSLANATSSCSGGVCVIDFCDPGYLDCNGNPSDGCEVNTDNDPNNCGSCGSVCSLANATSTCSGGVCVIDFCDPGYLDCNGNPSDGCEVNIDNDPNNCGSCGFVCSLANATSSCSGGVCVIDFCDPGYADCNNNATDGCEVYTDNDPNNCGSCGFVCSLANATSSCSGGVWVIDFCDPGYLDCNGNPSDGCECLD